jgi:hypothetical protein
MKARPALAALLVAVAAASAPALAVKIHIDYDQAVDFSKYETFAWKETPDTSTADSNDLFHRRMVELITSQLQQGSLRMAESDPDLFVTYHTNEKDELALNTTSFGYGYPSSWHWSPYYYGAWGGVSTSQTTAYTYTRGTLIIDIWDAREKKLVWRGSASGVIPDNPQKLDKQLRTTLEKMAKKWRKSYGKRR